MKIPRNVDGRDLADHLIRPWDFRQLRQSGSHIILRTDAPSGRTLSVPAHKPLKFGTFHGILEDIAAHKGVSIPDLFDRL